MSASCRVRLYGAGATEEKSNAHASRHVRDALSVCSSVGRQKGTRYAPVRRPAHPSLTGVGALLYGRGLETRAVRSVFMSAVHHVVRVVVFFASLAVPFLAQAQTVEDRTQDKVAFPPHKIVGNIHYVGTGTLNSYLRSEERRV